MIGIYMIKNKTNNKIYIGQAIDIEDRWKRGHINKLNKNKHTNEHLQRAWNKYGEDNFEFSIIEECEEELLNEKEIYWIDHYKSYDINNGYNMTYGGSFGRLSKEACKKISIAKSGKNHPLYGKTLSDEYKQKISNSVSGEKNGFYGRHHSTETKNKISKANKGEKNGNYGKHAPNYGMNISEDTRKKISKSMTGEGNPRFIHFSNNQIQDVCNRLKNKESLAKIAKIYNCSTKPIIRIRDQYFLNK